MGAQVQRVKDEPNNMPESLKLTDDESRPSYSELMDALTGPHWNQSAKVEPTKSSNQTEAG